MEAKSIKIRNRKAHFNYQILDKYEAGIELKGCEVKSVRMGNVSLEGAYVKLLGAEAFMVGMHINPYEYSGLDRPDPDRERRLLLHKREIKKIGEKQSLQNLTVVPLSLYFKRGLVKLEIALAKGKKLYDKRDTLKKKTILKEIGGERSRR
ncbi:MAG: SsrA-binding protein SmpB [Candidatus Omnitrophota bacterium]|nr:SsrA-binding protein SmpB [bacterium]MBU3929917.1 SsrA-binding protein SmpB [bacterium]MBU4122879.1 SsrA-binding protein SmpB [bacterium]MDO9514236.1 SsrA-binding protein SmpB [Elusimicrobiota bacterium]